MTAPAASPREEVASPCINVCRMNPETALCEGCYRTLDEIAGWSGMSAEERRVVLARLPARRPRP
jgi:predicted Fe-S protein YdhL (DUF1289 family)